MSTGNWDLAINKHYPFTDASDLQVKMGCVAWRGKSPSICADNARDVYCCGQTGE